MTKLLHQRYQLLETLGQGSVGTTYRAIDHQSKRQVAIKRLSLRHAADWKVIELFEREATVLARLDHPQIPQYLDYFVEDRGVGGVEAVGEVEGVEAVGGVGGQQTRYFYIVQQLAEGESLADWIEQGGRFTEREIRAIALQILDILEYLHGLEPPVVHRDLKPQNLIRQPDGTIVLVDFGAVATTYYQTMMRGSTVVGTYGYMAPEQFRGQAVPATDLYGLGATLLFLLTRRSPAELPTQQLKVQFRSHLQLSATFTDWLEQLLEPTIKTRFSSATEAKKALKFKSSRRSFPVAIAAVATVLGLAIIGPLLLERYKYSFINKLGLTDNIYAQIEEEELSIQEYLDHGGDPDISDQYGRTLIYWAIILQEEEMVKQLMQQGGNLQVVDDKGQTLLHKAARGSTVIFQDLLTSNQIDIWIKDKDEKTAIHYMEEQSTVHFASQYLKNASISESQREELFGQLLEQSMEKNFLQSAISIKTDFPDFSAVTWA
ncbi:MAG: protein kinase [Cyanobacteria bacterium P01_F01_bin.150]